MKKLSFLFVLSLFGFVAKAQQGFYLGANGGYNSVWIQEQQTWDTTNYLILETYDMTWGAQFGGVIGFNFTDHFGIEVNYLSSTQGQKYSDVDTNKDPFYRYVKTKYSQIPIMLRFMPGSSKSKFHLGLGVQIGSLKSATQTYTGSSMLVPALPASAEDVKERFNKSDLLGVFDMGVDIELGKNIYLTASLRANGSLKDINAQKWAFKDENDEYKMSRNLYGGLNFTLKYLLPVKKKETAPVENKVETTTPAK